MIHVSTVTETTCESCDKLKPCTHAVCDKGTLDANLCQACLWLTLKLRQKAETNGRETHGS